MDDLGGKEPPREIADDEWEQWMLEQELRSLNERRATLSSNPSEEVAP